MGSSQSTNRAAKFSGSRTNTLYNITHYLLAPSTAPMMRRQLSQRNINRNVKEFSKFWSNGELNSTESLRRSNSVRRNRVECRRFPCLSSLFKFCLEVYRLSMAVLLDICTFSC
uniref:Ovule protein n=1 Tax=Angiostrongylus cantonensis TaxID=6313 RepID=A0A0K0DL51_ANGCA